MTKTEYRYIIGGINIPAMISALSQRPGYAEFLLRGLIERLRDVGEKAEDAPKGSLGMSREEVYDSKDLILWMGAKKADSGPKTLDDAIKMFFKWRVDFGRSQLRGSLIAFNLINHVINALCDIDEKADHFRDPTKMMWHDAVKDPPKKEGFYWAVGFYLIPPSYERMPCRRVRLVKYSKILSADLGVEYYWEDVLNVTKWREADVPPLPEEIK